jgi:hypothetical protein
MRTNNPGLGELFDILIIAHKYVSTQQYDLATAALQQGIDRVVDEMNSVIQSQIQEACESTRRLETFVAEYNKMLEHKFVLDNNSVKRERP